MNMDLAVWSTQDFNFPAQLPRSTLWKRYDEEFAFEENNWQVLVLSGQIRLHSGRSDIFHYPTFTPGGGAEGTWMDTVNLSSTPSPGGKGNWYSRL